MSDQLILEVSQVNSYIREMMESDGLLTGLCIRGELSNYKKYPSGHHYFTLKDGESSLKCVMFRSSAMRLRFRPENGMTVLAAGRITVYPRDGVYQLYCVSLTPEGAGDLSVAFEQLKKKLSAEGLFDEAHKKPIPAFPERIALITSSAGAAVHDMLRILAARYPLAGVCIVPVRVQGEEAAGEISAAIDYVNQFELADLIITGRGGGSMEDLWAFNEEITARAIYRSHIPVISAVGHEPDVTISDYVADLRAATPSNAAELAVPDQNELRQTLDSLEIRMAQALNRKISAGRQALAQRAQARVLRSPEVYILDREKQLGLMKDRLSRQMQTQLREAESFLSLRSDKLPSAFNVSFRAKGDKLSRAAAQLDAMSPLKVLSRGYSITETADGTAVRSAGELHPGDQIRIRFQQGFAEAQIHNIREE